MLRRALLSVSSRTLAASSLRGGLASITETACRASCSAPGTFCTDVNDALSAAIHYRLRRLCASPLLFSPAVWRGIEAGSCRAGSAEQGFAAMGLRLRGVRAAAWASVIRDPGNSPRARSALNVIVTIPAGSFDGVDIGRGVNSTAGANADTSGRARCVGSGVPPRPLASLIQLARTADHCGPLRLYIGELNPRFFPHREHRGCRPVERQDAPALRGVPRQGPLRAHSLLENLRRAFRPVSSLARPGPRSCSSAAPGCRLDSQYRHNHLHQTLPVPYRRRSCCGSTASKQEA